MKVVDAINLYLTWAELRGLTPESFKTYRSNLLTFFETALTDKMSSLTVEHMAAVGRAAASAPSTAKRLKGRTVSARTMQNKMLVVKLFVTWSHQSGYLKINPLRDVKIKRTTRAHHETLTDADVAAITAQADPLDPGQSRDRAILWLLYDTGARIGEIRQSTMRDLSFIEPDRTLANAELEAELFIAHPEKGGERRPTLVRSKGAYQVKSYLEIDRPRLWASRKATSRWARNDHDDGLLFLSTTGSRFGYTTFYNHLAEWAKAAGIPFHVHPHMLRHSAATALARAGGDAERLRRYFGWASLTTAQHYVHLTDHDVLDWARAARGRTTVDPTYKPVFDPRQRES